MKSKVPKFRSDQEAANFLEQDLSDIDFAQFQPARFSFPEAERRVAVPLPGALVEAAKARASERGISYERYISQLIEDDLLHQKVGG